MTSTTREPLAIVGMGCRFPGRSDGPDSFWQMLHDGVDAICDVPGDRWDVRKFYDPDPASPGRTVTLQGGFLRESIWDFDPAFFGISPREASVMDPQQRLLLETTWEAFEHAGLDLDDELRRRTGVFVGAFCFDNAVQQMGVPSRDAIFSHSATSASMVMLSNRLSYVFDLQGPCFTVDTACSSSLVATHLGCRSLWERECDVAVIGGVNVMLRPESTILESKGGFLARDARCRAFDAAASGYVRAEGAGVVVVRPLAAALAAGDRILALIRGSGVNQDGRSAGITVPNPAAQEALIHEVCRDAAIDPRQIGYVEAHGTGTQVGDPIEANALGHVIGQGRAADDAVWIGSVKTNVGHLEAGAGVAGLMKAALCLAHQQVPPHLHLVTPNDKIDLVELGLRIPTRVESLSPAQGRFAAVNSFGYGGTNAHVILERAPAAPETPASTVVEAGPGPWLIPLSARAEPALAAFAQALAEQVAADPERSPADFAHALAVRRAHHDHRAAVIARDRDHLLGLLASLAQGGRDPALRTGRAAACKIAWVYTGMGAQWWGMGRGLFEASPVFRAAIEACELAWKRAGGSGLRALFDAREGLSCAHGEPMPEPRDAQPANLALQVGVTEVLRSFGLAPAAIVGHSVGEIGAAWAAGVLTLDDAFRLTFHRSRLQQEQLGLGTMLAAAMPAATARKAILELAPDVEIAAFNDEGSVSLGGAEADLLRIAAWAADNGIKTQLLKVGVAYHTRQMDPIRERFVEALSDLEAAAPQVPLYSTVTGAKAEPGAHDARYWWRNAREPVLLVDALEQLRNDGFTGFFEVGPHAVLGGSILRTVSGAASWPTQRRGADELATLLASIGDCYCAGGALDWRRVHPHGDHELRAPRYPFQRVPLWRETAASRADRLVEELHPLLHQRLPTALPSWLTTLNERFLPWLPDHRVAGALIFPGAGYAIAALAAAECSGRGNAVEELSFVRALEPRSQTLLRIDLDARDGHLTLCSQPPDESASWHVHATARLPEGRLAAGPGVDLEALRARCPDAVDVDLLYRQLASQGLQYGAAFRCIRGLVVGDDEALVTLDCGDADAPRYLLHPALLDAAFQSMLGMSLGRPGAQTGTYVPTSIRTLRVHAPIGAAVVAHVRITSRGPASIVGEIRMLDADGQPLAEVEGVRCQKIASAHAGEESASWLYAWRWEQAPAVEPSSTETETERWLVIADSAAATDLARRIGAATQGRAKLETVPSAGLEGALDRPEPWSGVLDLRAADLDPATDPTGQIACTGLLQLVQGLMRVPSTALRRLVIATRGAVPVDDAPIIPAAGAVWGLGRVVMTEQPSLGVKLLDLDARALEAEPIVAELWAAAGEDEVALRGEARHVPRLDRWRPEPAVLVERSLDEPLCLELGTPGVLDSFRWVPDRRRPPGPGQVEMRVHTASLNFKDLMKALNMLSASYLETTFIGDHIGMECAGTVLAVGEGVSDYAPGDEVIAIDTNGCFRSYHTVWTGYMAKKPAQLSFAAAPSLIAYVTPYYAMKYLAAMQPGETVLIHSASGGVGQAAIHIARWLGAKVIATAGSEAKRAVLREQGIEHVFDSRTLEFADAIRSITEGRGVDVVLNSLSGEAARKSLAALAPYGRFLEIGKKDTATGGILGLADFDRNLMYVTVDTDRMGSERPKLFRRLIDEVIALIESDQIGAVPTQEFPARDVQDAFRTMARARHVGKIVLDLAGGTVPAEPRRGVAIRGDRTWLVTGGLGGFGLQVAEWLVEQGARELVLVGRSGASRPEAQEALERMRARGAEVVAEAVDVADRAAVDALMAKIAATRSPLQGIVHGAMVLDDVTLDGLDPARLATVMRPKALGAWNLHEASRSTPLEAFVMFSSVATFIGNAGQGAYVAANGFLETLAWHRRALGLPALTVNWGAIADAGVVARSRGTAAYLESIGILGLSSARCTAALGHLLQSEAVQVGVVDMSWGRWSEAAGHVARSARFGRLVVTGGRPAVDLPAVAELRELGPDERKAGLQTRIRDQLARVMHQDSERVDVTLSLDNMGVDSLMALELISGLRAELGVELSAMTLMMQGVTVGKLAEQVLDLLFPPDDAPSEESVVVPPDVDVDAMSEAELDALLALDAGATP